MTDLSILVARATVALARRLCDENDCGCSPLVGSRGRNQRCGSCPLSDVDAVADELRDRDPSPPTPER